LLELFKDDFAFFVVFDVVILVFVLLDAVAPLAFFFAFFAASSAF